MLEHVLADTLPLAPEDEGHFSAEIDRISAIAVRRGGVDPLALFLQKLDRAGQIRHLRDRHPLRGTG